ncbi:MAG: hypothetical protein ACKO7W_10735 [Elainella sp.]
MNQQVELTSLTQEEILLAAETLNTAGAGKRRIILTSATFSSLDTIRQLPNSPGLPAGEIVPGVAGYLYNIPVFTDPNSSCNYML